MKAFYKIVAVLLLLASAMAVTLGGLVYGPILTATTLACLLLAEVTLFGLVPWVASL